MAWYDVLDKMFAELADTLDFEYGKVGLHKGTYVFKKDNEIYGFVVFLNRNGNFVITMSQKGKHLEIGKYTKEELNTKAKKEILVKLAEKITKH